MARGRRNPSIELNVDPEVVQATNPVEAGGEGVASLFDFSGEARVRVLHRNEKTIRYEPHGYFPANATEENILSEFGGGKYRVQLLVRDEAGREVIKTQRDIDLPGQYKPPAGDLPGIGARNGNRPPDAPVSPVAVPFVGGGDDLMQVLKAGIINTLLEMMKSTKEMSSRSAPAVDPMLVELMKQQSATQQQMMQFMLTLATKDTGSGENKDMLGMLAKMKEIVAPAAATGGVDPMQMFNTMLDTFTRMREVADQVATPQSDADPFMSSIPRLVEVVAEQHQMNKQDRERRTAPTPPPSSTPVVGTISSHAPTPELPLWQKTLRQQSARLLASAVAGHDAEVIAGTAILFAPPHVLEALKFFFHRSEEEVVADVLVEIPQMAEHRDWLVEFVNAAQYRLFPEEFGDDEDTTGEDAPDAGDAASASE